MICLARFVSRMGPVSEELEDEAADCRDASVGAMQPIWWPTEGVVALVNWVGLGVQQVGW